MEQHETLARHFLTFEKWIKSESLGSGHINDTFKIEMETSQKRLFFVLQRVNHHVFKKPESVAANARLVAAELEKSGCELQILAPFSAQDGSDYARDEVGNFWRVMPFSQNSFSPETADSPETAFEIARAFGHFLKNLRGLEPLLLTETIPDFHNTPARWLYFETVLAKNEAKKAENCRREIKQLFDQKHLFEKIAALKKSKKLPIRVVHSDTKAGNVLLDTTTKKAISVIDWDTAGPETALVDFADLVRSTASNLAEDDPEIENLELRLDILEAVGAGFLAETADFLTLTERENLLAGAEWIVFEQALRFLTDHLAGDIYYKIERDGHNLDRARNQFGAFERVAKCGKSDSEISLKWSFEPKNHPKMDISNYYNDLARRYDDDRFGNSYGQFLHRRETEILENLLPKNTKRTLDLACGTGRFSGFATDGLDQSAEMIAIACEKWPEKTFLVGDARQLPFENEAFGAIFSLHLAMHLSENDLQKLLAETHRCLEKGGVLVIDFPSKKRRKLLGRSLRKNAESWHGATAFDEKSFLKLAGKGWQLQKSEGVLNLPLHRFSPFWRPFLLKMDAFLGKSWIRGWSSYLFLKLEKV